MSTRAWARRLASGLIAATLAAVGLAPATAAAAPHDPAPPESRCTSDAAFISCEHNSTEVLTEPLGITPRVVHWQVPVGEAPAGGWPAVVVWSPSLWSALVSWSASPAIPLGPVHQTETYRSLLDNGFAVITPEAHLRGFTFWDTNNIAVPYDLTADKGFVEDVLTEIGEGTFGPINTDRLFATGMSSGGYMTSRMAVSHPGHFKALAIQSASYATCFGPICPLPEQLPADHPPTLFLHGGLDQLIASIDTMYRYRDKLDHQKIPTKTVVDPQRAHEFLPVAPHEITAWFQQWDPGPP